MSDLNFKTINPREDEFFKDGVIYCKTCKTARTVTSPDGQMIVRCACECMTKAYNEEVKRKEQARRMERLNFLKRNSLLGPRYINSSFNNLDLERPESFKIAVSRCQKYCLNWDKIYSKGLGIYIFGDTGTGKTKLTACICNYLLERNVTVLVTNFLEISKRLRAAFQSGQETEEQLIREFVDVDLLILDDIGTEKLMKGDSESFMQERIYDIINRRYVNFKPIIFSSNYSLQQLLNERGLMEKTVDRISAISSAVIHLDGSSYREVELRREEKLF